MAVLAQTRPEDLAKAYSSLPVAPDYDFVRPPETGLVMVRGRTGGSGQPFNLGEATVTRCVVRLAGGQTGHAYVLGRHKTKAVHAAVCDALWQCETSRPLVMASVLQPLKTRQEAEAARLAAETAATKVDFFTMVRGDD
ncbi:protein phnG [Roseibium aquae]|uniref:Protein phnG n=2 Tax=Roseibium aquae TaxID=1323746 RepID=A0A916WWE6_9HYPH|nr:protein phnG [Roseibium aquae]